MFPYLIDVSLAREKKSAPICQLHLHDFFSAAHCSEAVEYEFTYCACDPSTPSADVACTAAAYLDLLDFARGLYSYLNELAARFRPPVTEGVFLAIPAREQAALVC